MTNAEKFKAEFGIYATELWAMPEAQFLEWLNSENEPRKNFILEDARRTLDKSLRQVYGHLIEDEPQTETKTETQNSNLTFEKRTMRDCYNCKRCETEGECIECHYEPKTEPNGYKTKPVEDEPQTDCETCKYGQDKHRYAHICNECGVGINNYTPQTEERSEEMKEDEFATVSKDYLMELEKKAKDSEYFRGRVDGMEYVIDLFENAFKERSE